MPSLYIVLEQENPGFDSEVNGRALSQHEAELDQIAKSLSVTPLMEFFSVDPEEAAGVAEDSGGDPSSMTFEPEHWHEPSAGLVTVLALKQYAAEHPAAIPNEEAVLAELGEFERVLHLAKAHGVKWHLAVDY